MQTMSNNNKTKFALQIKCTIDIYFSCEYKFEKLVLSTSFCDMLIYGMSNEKSQSKRAFMFQKSK